MDTPENPGKKAPPKAVMADLRSGNAKINAVLTITRAGTGEVVTVPVELTVHSAEPDAQQG